MRAEVSLGSEVRHKHIQKTGISAHTCPEDTQLQGLRVTVSVGGVQPTSSAQGTSFCKR